MELQSEEHNKFLELCRQYSEGNSVVLDKYDLRNIIYSIFSPDDSLDAASNLIFEGYEPLGFDRLVDDIIYVILKTKDNLNIEVLNPKFSEYVKDCKFVIEETMSTEEPGTSGNPIGNIIEKFKKKTTGVSSKTFLQELQKIKNIIDDLENLGLKVDRAYEKVACSFRQAKNIEDYEEKRAQGLVG